MRFTAKLAMALPVALFALVGCGPVEPAAPSSTPAYTYSTTTSTTESSSITTTTSTTTPTTTTPTTTTSTTKANVPTTTSTPKKTVTTQATTTAAAACDESTHYINSSGNCVLRPTSIRPPGATGQCKDGDYTSAQHKQGACSHHGGVASWWGP